LSRTPDGEKVRKGRHASLLDDKQVRRWYDNLARGSEITAGVYLRRLGAICEKHSVTPESLLQMGPKDVKGFLLDLVGDLEKERMAGSYIHSNVKAVKSWLAFNDVEVKGKIRIKGAQETPTLKDEEVPTQEQLRKVFFSGDGKQKVACVLIAHSGLRPETLGDYKGRDGLKVSDFPELVIKEGHASFSKVPAMVKVRSNLSKAGHPYFTFLTAEGCQYLTDYLDQRVRGGEKLGGSSPIVTAKSIRVRPHVTTTNIGDMIRTAIRKAGFRWRPYVLRSYFDTEMMMAESRKLAIRDYRSFFMGHKGDIENRYTTNKGRLPMDVVEDMRVSFGKAAALLETATVEPSPAQLDKLKEELKADYDKLATLRGYETALTIIPVKGIPPEAHYEHYRKEHGIYGDLTMDQKIEMLKTLAEGRASDFARFASAGEEVVMRELEMQGGSPAESLKRARHSNGESGPPKAAASETRISEERQQVQKRVEERDLDGLMQDGWQFVATLPSGKVVVRKPYSVRVERPD